CLSKVFHIVSLTDSIYKFIVSQRILISYYQATAEAEIPGKKSIYIEYVDVFIPAGNKWQRYRITIVIYVCKTVVDHIAPIMSCPERQINAGSKIVNGRKYRCNIFEIDKRYNGLARADIFTGINDVIR